MTLTKNHNPKCTELHRRMHRRGDKPWCICEQLKMFQADPADWDTCSVGGNS